MTLESFQVGEQIKELGGSCTQLAPCISSMWQFPSYNLYNKLVIVGKALP